MTKTMLNLERSALEAHAAGLRWSEWWPTVADDVARAEPHNRVRYHRLVRKLLMLLTCGDLDGAEPIPVDPWRTDDAPADTGTAAKLDHRQLFPN